MYKTSSYIIIVVNRNLCEYANIIYFHFQVRCVLMTSNYVKHELTHIKIKKEGMLLNDNRITF